MSRIGRSVARIVENIPSGALWLIGSAVFFLLGSHGFAALGAKTLATYGLVGASGALAVAIAFCDWRRPKADHRQ